MGRWFWIVPAALLPLGVLLALWGRRRAKRKKDQEQVARKLREDSLDRALANRRHKGPRQESPFAIRYELEGPGKNAGEMLRLTYISESVRREYLFSMGQPVFLGEAHGCAAVFTDACAADRLFCELFSGEDGMLYARRFNAPACLARGRRQEALDAVGLRVRSGDMIETSGGRFLLELLL